MEANDVNRSEIQEQIKVQGEIVRKLKTEKADKDKVGTSSSDFRATRNICVSSNFLSRMYNNF